VVLSSDYGCIRIGSDYHGRELKEGPGYGSNNNHCSYCRYHLIKRWNNIPIFSFKLLDGILFGK
jgi:hypothetical protein